jgi:progressive ankylosis protein
MLKQRTIFLFWVPLALSWFLMTFEHPWVQGVIARLPDAQLQLAAFGLIISLMVLIETPIIMMLGTGAALGRNRQHYRLLWRYLMAVNALVTVVALAMGFTPLLDWYLGVVVGVEQRITDAVRPGIQIMALWPAFIGYRRFHQGIMIRNDHTRPIGYGTLVRLASSAGTAILLGWLTGMPGAAIGATAMLVSATVEMVYVIVASRVDVRDVLATELKRGEAPLTYRGAFKFHFPLALTSIFTLLVRPVIERGLASTPDPEATLAAWAVVFSVLLIARSGAMAWQEGVIALSERPDSVAALRRFSWTVGGTLTGLLALLTFTPLIDVYLGAALNIPENIQPLVVLGSQIGVLIPILTMFQSYYRGRLMHADRTGPIYSAMFLNFAGTSVFMLVSVWLGMAGIVAAVLSLLVGYLAELVYLVAAMGPENEALQPVAATAGD